MDGWMDSNSESNSDNMNNEQKSDGWKLDGRMDGNPESNSDNVTHGWKLDG